MRYPRAAKPIHFTTRLGPNFLWHMLAIGRIGYNSEYADRFEDSIPPDDLKELQRHSGLLRFGSGEGGDLAPFFSTLPGWLHVESRQDFAAYFHALDQALAKKSFGPLTEAFPHIDWSDPLVSPAMMRWEFPDDTSSVCKAARTLADIYLRAYDEYVTEIWPIAQEEMDRRVEDLARHFDTQDYIALWENCLKLCFRAPVYEIVVCFANKNGPDYNSLGFNGNLIYYDRPFDRTWQFISHEIGTHILIDSMYTLAFSGKYEWEKLYGAYEVMAMYFNRRILGLETLAYEMPHFDDKRLLEFYARTYVEGMAPSDLLRQAAEEFCSPVSV